MQSGVPHCGTSIAASLAGFTQALQHDGSSSCVQSTGNHKHVYYEHSYRPTHSDSWREGAQTREVTSHVELKVRIGKKATRGRSGTAAPAVWRRPGGLTDGVSPTLSPRGGWSRRHPAAPSRGLGSPACGAEGRPRRGARAQLARGATTGQHTLRSGVTRKQHHRKRSNIHTCSSSSPRRPAPPRRSAPSPRPCQGPQG